MLHKPPIPIHDERREGRVGDKRNFYVTFVGMKYRRIIVYQGHFEAFLSEQPIRVRAKILQVLRMIEELERIPTTYFKHLKGTKGLYEIRIQMASDIFRLLCCLDSGRLVVLLSAFQKKTQKTPRQEIERAERLMEAYYKEKDREAEQNK